MRCGPLWLLSLPLLASQAATADLTVATFNAEFLTRPSVHVKFGFKLKKPPDWSATERDEKFSEAVSAVAEVIAAIDADVIALTEVGNEADMLELNEAIHALGITYEHVEVCKCSDTFTQQKVAVLSKLPLSDLLMPIPGRAIYIIQRAARFTRSRSGTISSNTNVTIRSARFYAKSSERISKAFSRAPVKSAHRSPALSSAPSASAAATRASACA